jgi:hypothetical protein
MSFSIHNTEATRLSVQVNSGYQCRSIKVNRTRKR